MAGAADSSAGANALASILISTASLPASAAEAGSVHCLLLHCSTASDLALGESSVRIFATDQSEKSAFEIN